ncbi:Gluconate kinase [Alkalihalophilus pseudofirmus OF4]|uniref:Gluconate kinase n=1 Tax=Alkalihalophilus pseudofirmus (strain ATCC BAA-2126 / JCM 17055 / OF4) TaxID=398511 RepID=D3FUA2_ALKPO|nr:gluconokinase [Alkalihalophilus pseudofirmus]ADC48304.1 Gluconate kinase [Alkalihalophilus pseudofirmus OF4]
MSEITYVMGIDIGTTSCKAVLFTRKGYVVCEDEVLYPTHSPKPDRSEQDPILIEKAVIKSISNVIKRSNMHADQLLSVGLSAAMHSLICVDSNNEPLSPMLTWADRRSVSQVIQYTTNEYRDKNGIGLHQNGTPIHPMSPLFKLMWMKEQKYKPYVHASRFLSIKEFITARWFNESVVDYGIASATGLFNVHTLKWDESALKRAGIQKENLFTPVPPTYILKGLNDRIVLETGLKKDTPIALGSSDGPLANIGVGAINKGDLALTIGTSGAIRKISSAPADTVTHLFSYSITNTHWILGGPSNNGGNVWKWAVETVTPPQMSESHSFDRAFHLASCSPVGSKGLLFLPYLNGERAPLWHAEARGSWIGISSTHTTGDLLRSTLEGIVFNLYQISLILEEKTGENKRIFVNGGFARSPFWLQLVADIFGRDLELPLSHQSAAWGAAWFSLMAIGEESKLEDIAQHIPMGKTVRYNKTNHMNYKSLFELFMEAQSSQELISSKLAHYQLR